MDYLSSEWLSRLEIYIPHVLHNAQVAILGSVFALAISVALAMLAIIWRRASSTIATLAALTQAIPMIAVGPLIVLWFGFGVLPKILVATVVCFYPVMVSVADSVRSLRKSSSWSGDNLLLSPLKRLYSIYFPCLADGVSSGIKTTFTLSVIGAILADFIIPTQGLGRIINTARPRYDFQTLYEAIMLSACLGLAFYGLGALAANLSKGMVRKLAV